MSFSHAGKLEKKSKGPGLICHSAIKISSAEWREQHELCGELMAPMPVSWGKGAVADARSHQVGDLCTTFLCDRLPVRSKAEGQQPKSLHIIGPGMDI